MEDDHGDDRDSFTGGVLVTALAFIFAACAVLFLWILYANASDETIAWACDRLRDGFAVLAIGLVLYAALRHYRNR